MRKNNIRWSFFLTHHPTMRLIPTALALRSFNFPLIHTLEIQIFHLSLMTDRPESYLYSRAPSESYSSSDRVGFLFFVFCSFDETEKQERLP